MGGSSPTLASSQQEVGLTSPQRGQKQSGSSTPAKRMDFLQPSGCRSLGREFPQTQGTLSYIPTGHTNKERGPTLLPQRRPARAPSQGPL